MPLSNLILYIYNLRFSYKIVRTFDSFEKVDQFCRLIPKWCCNFLYSEKCTIDHWYHSLIYELVNGIFIFLQTDTF